MLTGFWTHQQQELRSKLMPAHTVLSELHDHSNMKSVVVVALVVVTVVVVVVVVVVEAVIVCNGNLM